MSTFAVFGMTAAQALAGLWTPPGWTVALVCAALGVAGAAGLLGVFWRPAIVGAS